ncbi:DUF58 domain-containing protein [Bradyrhizobium sp. WD16]|uniref:DUF58 domain-containing protein n=1 Tax=Bradyrhizobium sp. WD16 TaxID=1521768 RepID=UPI0020A5BE16|nr:DUF58 domain-containing protein [Bradyrhizobium sp. WD16]UTD26596.1 MxaS protein [Bradyrhizobium sp. WD16]
MTSPADILYRPFGRFRSNHVGAHSSSEVGGLGVFRDQTPFRRYPDARRIDIRATLRDPFGETYVRRFEQRSAIDVYVLVDLSASMGFCGAADRFAAAGELCAALAYSSTRIGDRFGLIGCGEALRRETTFPATRSKTAALAAVAAIGRERPGDPGAEGFVAAAALLGVARKLVFVVSDFRWPGRLVDRVFEALAHHDVVPLVLADSVEISPPKWGLLELRDSETGRRRTLLMRPGLRQRWAEREGDRRRELLRSSAGRARAPIFLTDGFDPVDLSLRLSAV